MTADLHWFPFFVQDWLASPAVQRMTAEQRGAYIQLLALAWGGGRTAPCLPADDDALALMSGLGKRWAKVGQLVKAQFAVRGDLLVNDRLAEVWHDQQARYTRRANAGKRSGKARAMKKQSSNNVPPPFEHAPMDMVLRDQKDLSSRGAGGVADAAPAPASGIEKRREAGGGEWMRTLIPKLAGGA